MARGKLVIHPDFEISIRKTGQSEVLSVGVFINEDETVDFGFGWDSETDLNGVRAILVAVEMALANMHSWIDAHNLDAANERAKNEDDDLPF